MIWPINKKIKVAVHNGSFHADDIMAVAILSLHLKKTLKVFRTRDISLYKKMDYLLDIGQEYNPAQNKFDHHQPDVPVRANGVPYATCGLLWREFGEKLSGSAEIAKIIEDKIIQAIDAEDNGVDAHKKIIDGVEPYLFTDYLYSMNSTWSESERNTDKIFLRAVKIVKKMLVREIKRAQDFVESKSKIRRIYKNMIDKRIMVLDEEYSWHRILDDYPEVYFIIRPVRDSGFWYASAVRVKGEKFLNKISFPENWSGKSAEELEKITGVSDVLFCHKKLFLCSTKTEAGAVKIAKLALQLAGK